MTTRSLAVGVLVAATLLLAATYAAVIVTGATPWWAPWSYLVGVATVMMATMVLGAARGRGGVGRLALPFVLIYALVLAGFGAALVLPAETAADTPLLLGLPRRAAIVLYGIGILPLFLLPLAYAFTFETMTLSDADLARVREARAAGRGARDAGRGVASEDAA